MHKVPVYIINMPHRTDRKNHMIKLMNDLEFENYTFITPYKANENTKLQFENIIGQKTNLPLTKISHNMTYLNLLLNVQDEKMIIMEDDIIPTKTLDNIKRDLNYIYTNHPEDADMVYMEMCYEDCKYNTQSNTKFIKLNSPFCAASIYYPCKNRRQKLYNLLIKVKHFYKEAIDETYRICINKGKIKAYFIDILFVQDSKYGSELEGSYGYKEKFKPMLPICVNTIDTIDYLSKNNEILVEIKNMYLSEMTKESKREKSFRIYCYILITIIFLIIFLYYFK